MARAAREESVSQATVRGPRMSAVDYENLRQTLSKLGYSEKLSHESAPLVHRILADLLQVSTQYTELVHNYEDLYAEWLVTKNSSIEERGPDGSDLSLWQTKTLDESFMLQAVEQAQVRYEKLLFENEKLSTVNVQLQHEMDALRGMSQSLSHQLQGKTTQTDALASQFEALKQRRLVEEQNRFDAKIRALLKMAVNMLPIGIRSGYEAQSSDSGDDLMHVMEEVLIRAQREFESQSRQVRVMEENVQRIQAEKQQAESLLTQSKATIVHLQNQIGELNAKISQREFERSLQADLASQLASIENVNSTLSAKVNSLERMRNDILTINSGQEKDVALSTIQAMLESLAAELHTETGFTGHLHQLVDKLNARRVEQDKELSMSLGKLKELESKLVLLESERSDLQQRSEKAVHELSKHETELSALNETTTNLGRALETKQTKIDEYRKQSMELKSALDSCNAAMSNMRRNEEKIRQHILNQDSEIKELRRNLDQVSSEKSKITLQVNDLHHELSVTKANHSTALQEVHRLSSELKSALTAQEKRSLELRTCKDQVMELEESLSTRRREKDLVMTTYCKAIKDNEKLQTEIAKLQEELIVTRSSDGNSDAALKALQIRDHAKQAEVERLKAHLSTLEAKSNETEANLSRQNQLRASLEADLAASNKEIVSLKSIVATLERSKKDLSAQLSRFGAQASELRNHLRKLEEERTNLQLQLRLALSGNPATLGLQSQVNLLGKEIEELQGKLRQVERERESIAHHMDMEKMRADKYEQMMLQERNKRIENELAVQTLEAARTKLKSQLDILNAEHEKSLESMKRQMQALHLESERHRQPLLNSVRFDPATEKLKAIDDFETRGGWRYTGNKDNRSGFLPTANEAPSPPRSIEDSPIPANPDTASRLKAENQAIREHLIQAQQEIKAGLSDDALGTYSGGSLGYSSENQLSPSSDEPLILSASDRIRRKLEQEHQMLMQIATQVREDLKKHNAASPPSSNASS